MFRLPFLSNKTKQLIRFAEYPERFRFFFLVHGNWKEGKAINTEVFSIDEEPIKASLLSAYLVTYRNGQLVYESKSFADYPTIIEDMEIVSPKNTTFTLHELTAGNRLFKIRFEESSLIKGGNYYKTTISNHSGESAKIIRFGGVTKATGDAYILNTITNDFFSESEFNNWYMDSPEKWIADGQEVFDPINYGGKDGGWIFEAELESGKRFWFSSLES